MIIHKKIRLFFVVCILFFLVAVVFAIMSRENEAKASSPYYNGVAGWDRVALCFNVDWGEEYIPAILSVLEKSDAKATFFLTGRWTEKFPDIALMIKHAGMEIGNHGLKHSNPNAMSYEENCADISAAEAIIEERLHVKTDLFAPAGGEIGDNVLHAAEDNGCSLILWSVDTIDWQKPSPETIVERVSKKTEDGSIILMHPTENTLTALPKILSVLNEKRLSPVTVSEIIRDKVETTKKND